VSAAEQARLLIVDDDRDFGETLASEFRDRGYAVTCAQSLEGFRALPDLDFDYAVVDLRLKRDSGLDVVGELHEASPRTRIVVLTGYGSIATAVQATKLGAQNYLSKPVSVDDLERVFGDPEPAQEAGEIPNDFQTLARHEREYIEWVLAQCDGNISRAARRLGVHRQSLQRKLRKFTPR